MPNTPHSSLNLSSKGIIRPSRPQVFFQRAGPTGLLLVKADIDEPAYLEPAAADLPYYGKRGLGLLCYRLQGLTVLCLEAHDYPRLGLAEEGVVDPEPFQLDIDLGAHGAVRVQARLGKGDREAAFRDVMGTDYYTSLDALQTSLMGSPLL